MGLLSDASQDQESTESAELMKSISNHTRSIAKLMSNGNQGIENKFYHHLMLTQKLLS